MHIGREKVNEWSSSSYDRSMNGMRWTVKAGLDPSHVDGGTYEDVGSPGALSDLAL